MASFPRPRVFCSRCITFEACRWNAAIISSDVIDSLKAHVDFVTSCPEKEIGLGVPRPSLRVIKSPGGERLFQPETGRDVTSIMEEFSRERIARLGIVDGFILKAKSPSCGHVQVKLYDAVDAGGSFTSTTGFFGKEVLRAAGHLPITDEGRLINDRLREDFLTRLYAVARFRHAREGLHMKSLVDFHASHKLILMAYSKQRLDKLGNIVANHDGLNTPVVFDKYAMAFYESLAKPPTYKTHVNVLMHALGYFKKQLSAAEKQHFLDALDHYRQNIIPASACLLLVQSWISRFNEDYLASQHYFHPFPEVLMRHPGKHSEE